VFCGLPQSSRSDSDDLKKVVNLFAAKSAPSQLLCRPQCKILATRLVCHIRPVDAFQPALDASSLPVYGVLFRLRNLF